MSAPDTSADRKLRILHVLRAPLGGLFRHVVDLASEQTARGHQVGLVVDSTTGGEKAIASLKELDLALGVLRLPIARNPRLRDVSTIFKTHAHAARLQADVVHGHGSKGGLYARAPGLLHLPGRPLRCYTPHGGSFNYVSSPLVQSVYMGVEWALKHATDVFLFESVYIANRFRDRVGETRSLVRIVQNGISAAEFERVPPAADAADFLYIGELRSAKGIDTLIDAMALLTRRLSRRLKLVLVGTGPDHEKLEAQARQRGVADQVAFLGRLDARDAFRRGRALVVPSRAESLPYIVLEGAGAQIPMIATDVGGVPEVFGPYRDRLIPPDDPVALATAMETVLDMPDDILRAQTEELCAFVAARFSVSNMADAVLAGYRDGLLRREAAALGQDPSVPVMTPCE